METPQQGQRLEMGITVDEKIEISQESLFGLNTIILSTAQVNVLIGWLQALNQEVLSRRAAKGVVATNITKGGTHDPR